MTIAAITEKYTTEHLNAFFPAEGITWKLVPAATEVDGAEAYFDLDFVPDEARCAALRKLLPALIIVNAVVPTLAEIGHPFVRLNGWPGFLERNIHELVAPDESTGRRVAELYAKLGRDHRLVADTPGMITARILSAIINEAYFTWEAEVSTKEEIDTAMRLGTNYPLGPFEWSERIGLGQVAGLLRSLSQTNEAYVPAKALQHAAKGLKSD